MQILRSYLPLNDKEVESPKSEVGSQEFKVVRSKIKRFKVLIIQQLTCHSERTQGAKNLVVVSTSVSNIG